MKQIRTQSKKAEFGKLLQTASAQAMLVELQPGDASDDEVSNEHPRCEQWCFVVSGTGTLTVKPKGSRTTTIKIGPGSLLVIEKQEPHQIRNTGRTPLRTINFYVPPAYDSEGEPLPSAKPRWAKRS
jgi:mannose-6-phosphate isomerase-like protein (cupin superfamily)